MTRYGRLVAVLALGVLLLVVGGWLLLAERFGMYPPTPNWYFFTLPMGPVSLTLFVGGWLCVLACLTVVIRAMRRT